MGLPVTKFIKLSKTNLWNTPMLFEHAAILNLYSENSFSYASTAFLIQFAKQLSCLFIHLTKNVSIQHLLQLIR
jgi:hypothetical protein